MTNFAMRSLLLILLTVALSACDAGFKQLGPTEYGVRFRKLPPFLGGGVANKVEQPGELIMVWPWDDIYVLDSKIQSVEWGDQSSSDTGSHFTFVETRALDGNEVSLAVRVQYHLSREPEKIIHLIKNVGTSNKAIEQIVVAAARSDIRTQMNKLKTSEFFINQAKYNGEREVLNTLKERLDKHGIYIQSVNLKEHRFERILSDGGIDRSYQERINQVQTLEQETERERLRKDTVIADKTREFNNVQAQVNRQIEEATGYLRQAKIRGAAYLASRGNEAKAIQAEGEAFIKGLDAQIKALSGQGGQAILKLELVKSLLKSNPKFVVMGSGSSSAGQGVEVRRTDTNELLDQIGVFEALKDKSVPRAKTDKTE